MSSATGLQPAVGSVPVLRVIAHELRQPLSTIEAIAYYLSLVLPHEGDGKIHEQLVRLQQLVEQSNWILSNSLLLSEPIACSPEPVDLSELITQTLIARPFSVDPPLGVHLDENLPFIHADPALARALVENVFTLFRQNSSAAHPVSLRMRAHGGGVLLEMSTTMPGIESEATLGPGAALALESARRIVAVHGGTLQLEADPASGIRLRVGLL
jgi:signal transduction histidine kinase